MSGNGNEPQEELQLIKRAKRGDVKAFSQLYAGIYTELFSSDDTRFGGSGITNGDTIRTEDVPMHGHEQSILLDLAPNTVIFLKCRRRKPKKADAVLAAEKEKT